MELYIVDYEAPSTTGPSRVWCASRDEAEARAEGLRSKYAAHRVGQVEQISKAELVRWLNLCHPTG